MERKKKATGVVMTVLSFVLMNGITGYAAFRIFCEDMSRCSQLKIALVVFSVAYSLIMWGYDFWMMLRWRDADGKGLEWVATVHSSVFGLLGGMMPMGMIYAFSYVAPDVLYVTMPEISLLIGLYYLNCGVAVAGMKKLARR